MLILFRVINIPHINVLFQIYIDCLMVISRLLQWNVCNLTPEFSGIPVTIRQKCINLFLLTKIKLSILISCAIRHISLVPCCVGLDRFHCTKFQIFVCRKGKLLQIDKMIYQTILCSNQQYHSIYNLKQTIFFRFKLHNSAYRQTMSRK